MMREVFSAEKYEVEKQKSTTAHATAGIHFMNDASPGTCAPAATAPLIPAFPPRLARFPDASRGSFPRGCFAAPLIEASMGWGPGKRDTTACHCNRLRKEQVP